jgi:hypothetical protein
MKRVMILIVVLLCTWSVAWAETSAPASGFLADSGDGCMLPDLSGLSPDQIAAAALQAGLQAAPNEVQVPACPTTFSCNSITNCGAGTVCTVSIIGPCCKSAVGPVLCCVSGNIKVTRCPCVCTGNPCAVLCGTSTDVKLSC